MASPGRSVVSRPNSHHNPVMPSTPSGMTPARFAYSGATLWLCKVCRSTAISGARKSLRVGNDAHPKRCSRLPVRLKLDNHRSNMIDAGSHSIIQGHLAHFAKPKCGTRLVRRAVARDNPDMPSTPSGLTPAEQGATRADWLSAHGIGVTMPFSPAHLSDTSSIVGRLVDSVGATGIETHLQNQVTTWQIQIDLLQRVSELLGDLVNEWTLILEFDIPRRGKRIDAVLLTRNSIVVLEFKIVGSGAITSDAVRQVEDYALELADFHAGSHNRAILPAVIATESECDLFVLPTTSTTVADVSRVGASHLARFLKLIAERDTRQAESQIDASSWISSPYRPTPTIIEAAQRLYQEHDVSAITRSDADRTNLVHTQQAIHRAIREARLKERKIACFVTGVPGAGKTLAGLNAVHTADETTEPHDSVLLSGNLPLVTVLSEALARDRASRSTNLSLAQARRESSKFIQNVHRFIRDYSSRHVGEPPNEHVVVFDEAQRAWDAAHAARKFKRPTSEPVAMLRIMDRHESWAVFVGLVGGGQEINTGEAGLREWGQALATEFRHWQVRVSPQLVHGDESTVGQTLLDAPSTVLELIESPDLHLSVPIRSYRATAMGDWVNAVLDDRPMEAADIASNISNYPIRITRSLDLARRWLRCTTRGLRRSGLVCSSGARRLRPWGIDPKVEFDIAKWFLSDADDVRSSNYLEIAATEFQIQGLELDRAGLCWDADLRVGCNKPHWRFRGSSWQQIRKPVDRQYLVNKYRVLLTRAREGLVIWVPPGSDRDPTRDPKVYDTIANYLIRCGVQPLHESDESWS